MSKYFTYILLMLFSCAFSGSMYAQESFVWVGKTYSRQIGNTPHYYDMYRFNLFTGAHEHWFRLDSTRFLHPAMTGRNMQIRGFTFTPDRTKILFLESEGDLYLYHIAEDSMEYLMDLYPRHFPFGQSEGWNYYSVIFIQGINDSLYYVGGSVCGLFNLKQRTFDLTYELPHLDSAFTVNSRRIHQISITKYKNEYIYNSSGNELARLNMYDPAKNEIILKNNLWPDLFLFAANLFTHQYDCDSTVLYVIPNMRYTSRGRTVYSLNVHTGEVRLSHNIPPFGADEHFIFDIKHFPPKDWKDCQRVINLDKDDSTAEGMDYHSPEWCTHQNIPISDLDVQVSNEYPVDSISISIQNPQSGDTIIFPDGDFEVVFRKSDYSFVVRNTGTTLISDFEHAVKLGRFYRMNSDKGGLITLSFTVWYKGVAGEPAFAVLRIADPLPDAGPDTSVEICKTDSTLALSSLLPASQSGSGRFYTEQGTEIQSINLSVVENHLYYRIESNNHCKDTALIFIQVNDLPEIDPAVDTTLCFGQTLDHTLSTTAHIITWDDGISGQTRRFTDAGIYHYTLTDTNYCSSTSFIHLHYFAPPVIENQLYRLCAGDSINIDGFWVYRDSIFTNTFMAAHGCDSLILNVITEFIQPLPLTLEGDHFFCTDNVTEITVVSNHIDLKINGISTDKNIVIKEPGHYILSGIDASNCQDSVSLEISEIPLPEVYISQIQKGPFQAGIKIPVSYSDDVTEYHWSPQELLSCYDCPYPVIMQKYSGTYSVEVSNDFGCINRAEVTIDFDDFKFVLPNVIMISSANEENGRFYLKGNGFVEYSLEIFDRWGNILYHKKGILSNDPASAWVPSECCTPGVYIYKITYSEDGVIKIIYGDITVL